MNIYIRKMNEDNILMILFRPPLILLEFFLSLAGTVAVVHNLFGLSRLGL